jgi:HlyD family secretion protein
MMRKRTKFLIGGCALATTLISVAAWRSADSAAPTAHGGHWQKPERQAVDQPLLLNGTLLPISSVNVVAQVNGRLVERSVEFGDRVVAGQPVARVDSPELVGELRDAEIAAIRADQELEAAQRIDQGAEYQAAQRRAVQAEGALGAAQRHTADTQALYDKGIVARTELEGVRQEVQGAEAQVQSARDELVALQKKRSPQALRILQLEAQGRREKLAERRAKAATLRITAPIAGVVLYPIAGDDVDAANRGPKEIKPGSALTTRDVILSVGDTTAFVVKAWVDEPDLQRLELRQPAAVMLSSDPSRELAGEVLRISSQARASDGRAGQPTTPEFEVQIVLRPPPGLSPRVGAAAKVRLTRKSTADGLLVPLGALGWSGDGKPLLRVRTAGSGEGSARLVDLARTTVDAVEIRSGLNSGDEVWVPDTGGQVPRAGGVFKRLFDSEN